MQSPTEMSGDQERLNSNNYGDDDKDHSRDNCLSNVVELL